MIRKLVTLRADQAAGVKRLALAWGVSEADVIRMAVDRLLATSDVARAGADDGCHDADAAWRAAVALMEARLAVADAADADARDWTRDAIYAERLDRICGSADRDGG